MAYTLEIDETTEVEVSIERLRNPQISHYAKAYLWREADIVEETRGTGYLYYCEPCIAAIEANKLAHGISFVTEDIRECECED